MDTGLVRPRLHFTANAGWINDPLGLTWQQGRYHLFFQHVPERTDWAPACRWGHATSPDLLTWDELPAALVPPAGEGCWSGTVVVPAGQSARLFYTRVATSDFRVGEICLAVPDDADWLAWHHEATAASIPAGEHVVAYRDPFVFHDGDTWRMIVGAGRTDGTALAYGYRSDDLASWSYTGIAASRSASDASPPWTGEVWECPQLFLVDDQWVLTFSVWKPMQPYYQAYAVGTYEDGVFTARSWDRLSYGPCLYAGSVFRNRDGSPGIIYWLRGIDDPEGRWAGAHSVPHDLRLEGDRLMAAPTAELLGRRGRPTFIDANGTTAVPEVADIEWSAHDQHQTSTIRIGTIEATLGDGRLRILRGSEISECPATTDPVRVLLDNGVIEFFTGPAVLAVPWPTGTPTVEARNAQLAIHPIE